MNVYKPPSVTTTTGGAPEQASPIYGNLKIWTESGEGLPPSDSPPQLPLAAPDDASKAETIVFPGAAETQRNMHKETESPEFREKVKEIVRECFQEWARYSQEQERMRPPMSIGYGGGGGPRGPESLAYDFYNARGTDSRGGNQGGGQGGGGQGGGQGGNQGGGGQGGNQGGATAHYGYGYGYPYYNPYLNPYFGGNGNGR